MGDRFKPESVIGMNQNMQPGHGHCFVLLARGNFGQIQTFSAIENGDSKAAYLERHKPLSDNERESLLADAFEPVAYVPTPD